MSEKLFRFLLSELETVRVKCMNCSTTVEIRADQINMLYGHGKCKICDKELVPQLGMNAFNQLAQAIATFKAQAKDVEIEFTLPDNG